jgi:outer membrane protein TolC
MVRRAVLVLAAMIRRSRLVIALALGIVVASATGGGAQLPSSSPSRLRLDEAVKLALERNLDLKIERLNPQMATAQERAARGGFDPLLDAGVTYAHTERFLNSVLESQAKSGIVIENIFTADFPSLSGRLPTGTQYSLTLTTPITNSNHPLRLYDEAYQSALTLGFIQPLLRDFGLEINMVRIDQAKISSEQAARGVEARMLEVIRQAETSYWTLYYAEQHVDVAQNSLTLGEDLVAQLTRMRDAGLVKETDVAQAQVVADHRRAALAKARADLQVARGQLRLVVDPRLEGAAQYSAADRPPDANPPTELAGKRERALAARPEIKQQELLIANMALEERLAVNATQWRFDLLAGGGYNSLAGSGVNPTLRGSLPSKLEGRNDYSDIFDDYFTTKGNTNYWAGARLRIPLGNNEALGRLQQVRLRRKQEELRLAQLKVQIVTDLEGAFEEMTASTFRLAAARREAMVAKDQLANRQRELGAGLATSHQVLEAQDVLARAQDAEALAWITYAVARSKLEAGYAQTFDTYRLVIER